MHVCLKFDRERLIRVYDEERLRKTVDLVPDDDTPLTTEKAAEWVHEVYRDGWTSKEKRCYEQAKEAFQNVVSALRPLCSLSEAEEEFYGLFQTVEVLPIGLYKEYDAHMREKRYLLANQMLVPIPLGSFHMLNGAGLLERQNGVLIANVAYDEELGLLPKEVDIDASLV